MPHATRPLRAILTRAAICVAIGGCTERDLSHVDMTISGIDAERRTGSGGYMSLDILLTDADGKPIPCSDGDMDLVVEVAPVGSDRFTEVPFDALAWRCNDPRAADVAIVADNSRSALDYLDQIQLGAHLLTDQVLADGGRTSLIRVETEAHTILELTDDADAMHAAIDDLYVTRGWSALYDGFRMANETLGGDVRSALQAIPHATVDDFCDASRTVAIAAFTDGDDNNSAGQSQSEQSLLWYPGDGIDTTFDDVLNLRVDGITTPFYTVGLGYYFEDERMTELAHHTGGRYLEVTDPTEIPDALATIGEYLRSSHQVCAELPARECGDYTVRIDATWTSGDTAIEGAFEHTIHLPCDVEPTGRQATVLLTLGNRGIPADTGATLARNTVAWVSPVLQPRVLVVLDDAHHGENASDALRVHGWLLGDPDNTVVDFLEEPSGGLSPAHVEGYDVVWLSNPGYPMDDKATFDALLTFASLGGGVVLQGDDMGWSWGNGWSMAPLTHADWGDNGVRECGALVNNDRHGAYEVAFADGFHPIARDLTGARFSYGDDIDFTAPRGEGETVVAWANLSDAPCRGDRPVVLAYDPEETP